MVKKKILIVDNDINFIEDIKNNLKSSYRVLTATNSINAFNLALTENPDLILLDINIDEGGGLDIFGIFRTNNNTKTIPVILLTTCSEEIENILNQEHVPDDIISKPLDLFLFKARIKTFFVKMSLIKKQYEEKIDKLFQDISFSLPHEFRTSINGIIGFSNIIIKETNNNSIDKVKAIEINEMAVSILNSGKRLQRLTENILFYSQLLTYIDKPEIGRAHV